MKAPAPRRLVALLALAGALSAVLPVNAAPVGAVSTEAGRLAVHQEKVTLANGFEVILVEDHRLPLVAFNLWVHAGPRNEAQGQTGFAHLFEHLMFAGSRHVPRGEFDKFVDAAGGTDSNGSTNFDRTNYFFTLPSNQLELGLWLKADMLGYMIDEVDSVSLANQQDVVRNERRQSFENRPYGIVEEALYQALYPEGHPYRAAVIGSHADIQSIKLKDVKDFARTYYRPNNATLVLAGDFDPQQAKALVQKYFGSLKAGDKLPKVKVATPEITQERRLVVTDRIELSRLNLAWHTPPMFAAGDAELDVAAHVLGGGKASRLYGLLVRDKQLAQSVQVSQDSQSLSSVFNIEIVARPGASLDEIEKLTDAELAKLATTPPSEAELNQARATIETQLLQRMEKVTTLADLVNHYNQMAGDPDFVGKDLARYGATTPAAVSATVAQWLKKDRRVVVLAQPGEQVLAAEVATPPAPTKAAKGERESLNALESWRNKAPGAGKAKPLTLPAAQSFTLANGLTVIFSPKPGLPLVSASLTVRAGQGANPAGQPGLAGFVSAMLPEGTTTRSAQQIAEAAAALGATLNAQAGSEEARVEFSGLKASAKEGLALLADVALNPAFAAPEIERQKAQRLAALAQTREEAALLANVVGNRVVYGEGHPLAANALGTEASIKAVDAAALRGFWQGHYRPERAALVVAGDLTEAELRGLIEPLFGAWKAAGEAAPATPLPAAQPIAARTVVVDKPGAPQTALAVVAPGPFASTPDWAPVEVMNAALGGLFTSRINNQLREVKGYTYGIFSGYAMGRERGQFGIRGSVRTDVTGASLTDMWKEIQGMRAKPMGAAELKRVRNARLLSLPGSFDTNQAVVGAYAANWTVGRPLSAVADEPKQLAAVTAATAQKAARDHLDPNQLIVVAVGDKAKILPQLQAIGRKAELRDTEGKPQP
ncbi:M16 family metallopeptidase [Roseateles sp. NT4]|uniref:M16 family metallopeptidase n=1 Tax=Roseateles sp. NT4 TaxID=3453715 RepID=UPI003EF04868